VRWRSFLYSRCDAQHFSAPTIIRTPVLRWLSLRVRIVCVVIVAVAGLLPPYLPSNAGALPDDVATDIPQVMLVEDGFLMKSSSLTQQGSRRAYAEGIIHVVQGGENLDKIAKKYGLKTETISWANKLEAGRSLQPGQELIILPVDGVLHTVSRGQSLLRIAELYSIAPEEIRRQNNLEGDFILVGQELIVPGGAPVIVRPPTQIAAPVKPGTPPAKPSTTPKPQVDVAFTPTTGLLQMPCANCLFTQYYTAGHYAVDIQTKGGGPIFAAEDGEVIRADYGWQGGYGNVIEIDHGNGLTTLYGHNKELYVKEGDRVSRGQQIAWMGNTGRVYGATGIHVHFEVLVNGVKKNPLLYLQ
jgi:LysM repeat protein